MTQRRGSRAKKRQSRARPATRSRVRIWRQSPGQIVRRRLLEAETSDIGSVVLIDEDDGGAVPIGEDSSDVVPIGKDGDKSANQRREDDRDRVVTKKTKKNRSTPEGTKMLAQVQHQEQRRLGEERKTNPNFGFVYHVMNNTCIYLRAKRLNIYMYRRRRIYKEPPGEIQ
jgi:hypothetical protein